MCEKEQRISLVGIGMGTEDGVTVRVQQIIRSCDCLIGAQRMLECAQRICAQAVKNADTGKVREMQKTPGQKAVLVEYRPAEIISYIEGHPEFSHITVLLSGDTGFYSGAKRLAAQLAEQFRDNAPGEPRKCRIELAPGISSVAYLAARLGTSWEDAALVSLHGKDEDFIQTVDRNRKTILLLGGGQSGEKVLGRLKEYGMDHVTVHAGSRLSYEDERIVSGKPSELSEKDLEGLCTVLIENPFPERGACPHVRDGEFIRGRVPMTKEEVRAASIARLQLTEDAVVWDVGAGTGSVSVEAARSGNRIRVYAVEKNPGTCVLSTGRIDDWWSCSICARPTTEMVIGRWRMSVSFRVPVTTTSFINMFRVVSVCAVAGIAASMTAIRVKKRCFFAIVVYLL